MAETLSSEHYSATLIDYFEHPHNAGAMPGADAEGFVINPVCGDSLRLFLRIERGGGNARNDRGDGDDRGEGETSAGDRIVAASFLSSGCPAAIATSSVATELIAGRLLAEAEALTREDYAAAVGGLPKSKLHCSVLAQAAVRNAVRDWRAARAARAAAAER